MSGGEYAGALFAGLLLAAGGMVYAICFLIIVGRWMVGDEDAVGVFLRASVLAALFAVAIRQFPTFWFWAMVPLAVVPLVDVWWGGGLSTLWIKRRRRESLGQAMADLAPQPNHPILRVRYARALLESGEIASGLAELDRALKRSDEGSRKVVEEMAAEAKQEFVSFCPICQSPNVATAKACRQCLKPYGRNPVLQLALWVARPVLAKRRL